MNILVTGASGFVGRHVVSGLLSKGYRVTAVARNENRAKDLSWFGNVNFVACDIHSRLFDLVSRIDFPDAVIHLAWPDLPDYGALSHIEETLPANYQFLKSLVSAGVKHILVSGTCFEYGTQNGCLAEDIATCPTTPYAIAKDCLRKFLQSLQEQYPFCLQWARLFYLYGEGQHHKSLIMQLDRAISSGDTYFNMSGGEQLRDYLPVETVASYLIRLMETPLFDGIINVCSGVPVSIRRLVEEYMAKRNANIQLKLGSYPYPDYEPMAFWGNNGKLIELINIQRQENQ